MAGRHNKNKQQNRKAGDSHASISSASVSQYHRKWAFLNIAAACRRLRSTGKVPGYDFLLVFLGLGCRIMSKRVKSADVDS